jgi:hypothetical protein
MFALCAERYLIFGPRFQYPRCLFLHGDDEVKAPSGSPIGREALYAVDRLIHVPKANGGEFWIADIHNGNVLYGEEVVNVSIPHGPDDAKTQKEVTHALSVYAGKEIATKFHKRHLVPDNVTKTDLDDPERMCRAIDVASRDQDADDLKSRLKDVAALGGAYQKMLALGASAFVEPSSDRQGDFPVPTEVIGVDQVLDTLAGVLPPPGTSGRTQSRFDVLYENGAFDYLLGEGQDEDEGDSDESYQSLLGFEAPDSWMSSPESDVSDGTLERCVQMASLNTYAFSEDEFVM